MYQLDPYLRVGDDASCVKTNLQNLQGLKHLVVEVYPGVEDNVYPLFEKLGYDTIINTKELFLDEEELTLKMQPFLTDDRVRGRMCYGTVEDFMDSQRLANAKTLANQSTNVLIFGFGASIVSDSGIKVLVDVTRWEIQLRYRKGLPNYKASNFDEDILRKYKRGYFVEWRLADRLKRPLLNTIDYYIDASTQDKLKMITGNEYRYGLEKFVQQPFRLVPYFDPGVWGGDWMKHTFHLPENGSNYAWSFDGVPEENSLNLAFGETFVQTPAINLVFFLPQKLLGEQVYQLYGAEFPIRFDYLDTMGGQNLSLQVHPPMEIIHREFGMAYTQSESYYLMQSGKNGVVYLGVKEDIDHKNMFDDLRRAQIGEISFDAEKYINIFPAKKHDHFSIPPGTVHCSGANTVVLEISNTPYIFTFKLWDWDRVGLDGLPRPTHIDLGEEAIDWSQTTEKVIKTLVNPFELIYEDEHTKVERTGLAPTQTIETTRISTSKRVIIENIGKFSMMNLVDGQWCDVVSDHGTLHVHYGETFIVPASIEKFYIESNHPIKLIRAQIRRLL